MALCGLPKRSRVPAWRFPKPGEKGLRPFQGLDFMSEPGRGRPATEGAADLPVEFVPRVRAIRWRTLRETGQALGGLDYAAVSVAIRRLKKESINVTTHHPHDRSTITGDDYG